MQRKLHVVTVVAVAAGLAAARRAATKLRARDLLNKGVNAYKSAQFDVAIEDFKQAKDLDPTLTNAQLYLATAYASQYIPGAPSAENVRNGEQAISGIQGNSRQGSEQSFRPRRYRLDSLQHGRHALR